MTTIWSASSTASSIECVTSSVVVARSIQIRCSSWFMRRRVIASSAPNGSSSSSTSGSVTRARAIATRWRMPPDSCAGRARSKPVEADQLDQLARSCRASSRRPVACNGEADVVADRAPRQQRRVLEGDAEAVVAARRGGRLAVDEHRSGGRLLEVGEDPQDRSTCRSPTGPTSAVKLPAAARRRRRDSIAVNWLRPSVNTLLHPADVQPVADHRRGHRCVDHHDCDLPFSWSGNTSA